MKLAEYETVLRNVRIRLACLGKSASDVAKADGISSAAFYKRVRRIPESLDVRRQMAVLLQCRDEALTADDPRAAAETWTCGDCASCCNGEH